MICQVTVTDESAKMRVLLGGDSACAIWRQVWDMTVLHQNEARLDSDVFVVPHHGSYTFFTERCGEDGRKEAKNSPTKESMSILGRVQEAGRIVCSSRPVSDANYDDDQPPHTEATDHYKARAKKVGGEFLCTMETPSKEKPAPIVIEVSPAGPTREDSSKFAVMTSGALAVGSRWGEGCA